MPNSICAPCRSYQAAALYGKLVVLIASLAVLSGCGSTAGPGLLSPVVWLQQYGAQQLQDSVQPLGFGPEAATALGADHAGNVLVAGYVAGSFAGYTGTSGAINAYLGKYAPDGTPLWVKQFPAPSVITGVKSDPSNNIVAIGAAFVTSTVQVFVVKTDASGNPFWYVTLPASVGESFGQQVQVENDGSIIVAGFGFFNGSPQEAFFAAKLSGVDGHILWVNPVVLPGLGLLTGMTLDASGNPLLIALASDSSFDTFPFVAKLNQVDGSAVWLQEITSAANSMIPFSITTDSAGNPLVGGGAYKGPLTFGFQADPQESAVLYKFSATDGTQQWKKTLTTGKGDSISGLQTGANGAIYAVGYTNGQFNFYETRTSLTPVFLLTLSSDGTLNSAHQFGTGPLVNATVPFGPMTAMDPSGNIFVSGATTGAYPGFTNDNQSLQMFIAKLKPPALLTY